MSESTSSDSAAYMWRNARVLAAEVPIAPEAAAALLPDALESVDPPTATIFIADYPETTLGLVYREAGILLHAQDAKGPASHCPWMVVDDDVALILGREMLGYPKKMAKITLEERARSVVGSVSRKAVEIMRIEATLGEADSDPPPFLGKRAVNAIGTLVTGMKLIDLPAPGEAIHAARLGQGKLTLTSSEHDALGELRVPADARVRYMTLRFGGGPEAADASPALLGDVDENWTARNFFARAR